MSVNLDKITDCTTEVDILTVRARQARPILPWYPLTGHREGLRANDMITLASAISVLSLEGGTAHRAPIPGTVDRDGNVVAVRF